jgi:hypothetical protein
MQAVPNAKKEVKDAAAQFCEEYPITEKISFATVCRMFKDFNLSVF